MSTRQFVATIIVPLAFTVLCLLVAGLSVIWCGVTPFSHFMMKLTVSSLLVTFTTVVGSIVYDYFKG